MFTFIEIAWGSCETRDSDLEGPGGGPESLRWEQAPQWC